MSRAFTLIELLVVMAILAVLGGMLMPLLGIAQRQSRITGTRATLMKVDQAVRLFRTEMKVYPWQTDLSTADTDAGKLSNNLGFRLAWKPTDDAERAAYARRFHADLAAIHARFRYLDGQHIGQANGDGTHAFRTPNVAYKPYVTNILMEPSSLRVATPVQDDFTKSFVPVRLDGYVITRGLVLSRLADEVTSLRYLAGQLDVTASGDALTLPAPQGIDPALPEDKAEHPEEDGRYGSWWYRPDFPLVWQQGYTYVPYNRRGSLGDDSRGPVLDGGSVPDPVGEPGGKPVQGWRAEYLAEALRVRPPGSTRGELSPDRNAILDVWGNPLLYLCAVRPGSRGYCHASDNGGGGIDERRYGLEPKGRRATEALASDLRTTAARPYVLEFELWSAGPDGRAEVMRDAAANRDNIALIPYAKGLQ